MTTKLYAGTVAYHPSNNLLSTIGDIHSFTNKSVVANDDITVIEDSADSYNKKKCKASSLITSVGAFGSNEAVQYVGETASTDTVFSTTSTTYQDLVTLTKAHTAGDFVLFFNGMPIDTNQDYRIWNVTDGNQTRYMVYDIASPRGFISGGFAVLTLPARTSSFKLQFRSLTEGGPRYFRYAKLLLFQVR